MNENQKFDLILSKLDNMENKFSNMESKLSNIESRLSTLEDKVSNMESRLSIVEDKISKIESKLDSLDNRLNTVENDVKDIKITLENEIRVNIQRIAEGHLDLARNLQKAQKPSAEVENLIIQVNMLQTDVQLLKQKIS